MNISKPRLDSEYTVVKRRTMSMRESGESTVDGFLRNVVLPEVTRLTKLQEAREISRVVFCYAKTKDGDTRALVMWRELSNG
jgi:hypothetical protein